MDFFKDLFLYMRQNKKFWILPLILLFLVVGILVTVAPYTAIVPMIYTLF